MGPTDDAKSEVDSSLSTPAPVEQATPPEPASTPTESAAEPAAAPKPSPEPAATSQPSPEPSPDPVIASTVTIPAGEASEGGEWDLLQEKIQSWIDANQLSSLWQQLKLPVQIVGGVIVFVLVLQIYGGIIRTIAAVPLAPGLLELAGLIAVANFSARRLVKTSERKQVLQSLRERWTQVVGR